MQEQQYPYQLCEKEEVREGDLCELSSCWLLQEYVTGAMATEVGIKTSVLEVTVVPLPLEMGTCLLWTDLPGCQVGDNMRGQDSKRDIKMII